MKVIIKIIKHLFIIIASLFVIITVYQRVMPNKSIFGYRNYVIVSNSMSPKYTVGDMIISKETNPGDLKIKDVIVYYGISGDFQGKIITHQIEEIYKELDEYYFTTRGIANQISDAEKVKSNQIYGKVIYKFKLLSLLSKLVRNKYGALICVLLPLMIIFGIEFKELKNKILNLENK